MSITKGPSYRFGDYRLNIAERVLKRHGEIVPLPLKPFEVLLVLVEQHGQVVSKEELMRRVWPDSFVEEANLARHIYLLRQTLRGNSKDNGGNTEKGDKHRYIQTIPGRGYLFASEVETAHLTTKSEKAVNAAAERLAPVDLQPRPRWPWKLSGYRLAVALLTLIILVSLPILLVTFQARVNEPLAEMTIERLINNAKVLGGSISPDGKYIVSILEENGQQSIWVRLLESGSEKQIAPPTPFDLGGISFSPDSSFVYYNSNSKQVTAATLYQVPIIGGTVRKIREGLNSPASFAPDGYRFVFVREDQTRRRSSLLISSLNGEAERELTARTTPDFLDYPSWSPDGTRIVCTFNAATDGSRTRLLEVDVADGAERLLPAPSWRFIRTPIWLKDNSGLVVNVEESFLFNQVWFLPLPSDERGGPRRLTSGVRVWRGLSVTDDARELVFTERNRYANVWVAPSTAPNRATKITAGTGHYEDLMWTPDGRLLYTSDTTGFWNIWLMNADGTGKRQLTFDKHENGFPSASPDGRYVFYESIRNGASTIWRMNADGSDPKQLTFGGDDFAPHCTPDGQWVIFTSYTDVSAHTLRKVPVEGGEPVTLSENDVREGIVSPDGRFVACLLTEGGASRSVEATMLAVISLVDGATRKLGVIDPYKVSHSQMKLRWTTDSRGIVYADSSDDYSNLWIQPLAGGQPRRLTDFQSDQIFGFDFSRDGRLAILRGTVTNEIVRINNPGLKPAAR